MGEKEKLVQLLLRAQDAAFELCASTPCATCEAKGPNCKEVLVAELLLEYGVQVKGADDGVQNDVRLIDANALKFQYAHMIYPDGTESLGYHAYVTSVQVKAAPTIDAESLRPVARWVNVKTMGGADCVQCSGCGYREYDHVKYTRFDYCPGCGARMKGANDG